MTYHRFWKCLNNYPNEPHGRWDNNYVLKTSNSLYIIMGLKWVILLTPFLPLGVAALITQSINIHWIEPDWVFDMIFFTPIGLWGIFGIWKILPFLLKKYNIIVYYPTIESQNNDGVDKVE